MTIVKGQTNIKICSINPRSVKNITLQLCDYIIPNDFDIVTLTETWLGTFVDKAWTRNSTWRNKLTPSVNLDLHTYIRKYITTGATKSYVNAQVTSTLGYCNAFMIGLLKKF